MVNRKLKLIIGLTVLMMFMSTAAFAQRGGVLGGSSSNSASKTEQHTLRVNVSPSDADVFINGDRYSSRRIQLDEGRYSVRVTAAGYQDYNAQINLNRDQTLNINLQPIQYSIRINANVPDPVVFVNNTRQNGSRFSLSPGNYVIRVEAPGFQVLTRRINVTGNRVFNVSLVPDTGFVSIDVPDSLRDFRVSIGDVSYNRNQLENIALSPGSYVLRMDIGGLVGTVQFDIASNERLEIEPVMTFQFDSEDD